MTKTQGIEFLREYRENPGRFLSMIDHQYKQFGEWEDEDSRNLCWDAGIYEGNRPYFAECWKIFSITVMTVFIYAEGLDPEPDTEYILVEFIRNGLITGLSGDFLKIDVKPFTDGAGNRFLSVNLVLSKDEEGQFIRWGRGGAGYEELNELNRER